MKETVLLIGNDTSGIYLFRKELVQSLVAAYHVVILAPDTGYVKDLRELGAELESVSFERHGKNPVKEVKLFLYYYRTIRKFRPKVVLTYTIKPNIYAGVCCQLQHVPYLVNITGLGDAIENPGILSKVAGFLYKIGIRGAEKVFFQNKHNCDYFLSHGFYKGAYDILPGSGVNLQNHPFEPYPEKEDPIVLLVVGRILKDKGIEEILEASEQFSGSQINIRLIGDCEGDYLDRIHAAEKRGVIQYFGRQYQVHEWYKNSHAILHASYHEGMSNVLLEAASSGRPILASDIPGCAELFDEGISGFGFSPKNASAIVNVIHRFLKLSHEEKAEMGRKGREKIEKQFNREIVVNKYLETIRSIE